ncbi:ABC transporter substrate-binding protein [Streptomyces hainanensis]|uniref:Extracellular solute-binding protein n=1 Tax=Streptomyces hainanensis TaxID=402648 RepID=A0A4R4TC89_9ACTN|nr:extracellular solute-binding protein [Streptomyces hainanensis]TDC72423.1 extracellular solute-binding protein [Streptomyces hainanensis]
MSRHVRNMAAVLAVATGLATSACGTGGGGGGGTTLSLLSWNGEQVMTPVIEAFEEAHPDIDVEASYSPPVAEYIQSLQTRVLSGTAPDVFLIAAENKTNLIEGGHVLDLAGEEFLANVPEFNQRTYGADGAVHGLSLSSWGGGILYNEDLLADVGAEAPPETWEEFLDLCATLQDAGITPYLEPVDAMPGVLAAFLGAYDAANGNTMDDEIFAGTSTFEEHWTPLLEQYYRLYDEGLVTRDTVGITADQVQSEFANGRVAMITAGPWTVPPLRDSAPDLNFRMAPVPGVAGGEPYLSGAASPGYAINPDSENIEAARTFLSFLASPEGIAVLQEAEGSITVTSDFDPPLDEALDPIVDDVRAGNLYLPQISWQRAEDVLNIEAVAQIQRMVQGEISPREVAQALDRKLAAS